MNNKFSLALLASLASPAKRASQYQRVLSKKFLGVVNEAT